MNVVVLHGKDTNPDEKWYPWLKQELQKNGIKVDIPKLPSSQDPVMSDWKKVVDKLDINQDTVLVDHSRGGVLLMRWLENREFGFRIKKAILVATNSGDINNIAIPSESNHGFYTDNGYDFEKIKTHCDDFVVIHSQDDEWVPYNAGIENSKGLQAPLVTFTNKGHFGRHTPTVPEILEQILICS